MRIPPLALLAVVGSALFAAPLAAPLAAQSSTRALPATARAWYLPTDDRAGELFVYEIGPDTGAPVVVLHGGPGGELTHMLPVARDLETTYHWVFYDQRGSLRSAVPLDSITMEKHVADLETIRRALGVERIRLLSHSAGTLLAFEYLRLHPDHVAQIALVGALPHKNGTAYFDEEYAAFWRSNEGKLEEFSGRPAVVEALRRASDTPGRTPEARAADARLIRQLSTDIFHIERWSTQVPVRVRAGASERTRATTNFEYDYGPLLAAHPFGVAVINGEFDLVVGPRGSPLWKRLAETVAPNVGVVVIPNAGHSAWIDDPVMFREAVRAVFARSPGGQSSTLQ